MADERQDSRWRRAGLACAVAVPLFYFGAQAAGQLGYSGYDWTRQLASELGSAEAPSAWLFNAGMLVTGTATLSAALGYQAALKVLTGRSALPWLTALSLVSSGAATLWAGLNPLPDPNHNPGLWGVGTILFPLLLLLSLVHIQRARALCIYLAVTVALELVLVTATTLSLSAATAIPPGLLQRLGAILVYVPVAIGAIFLLRRVPDEPRR